MKNLLVVVPFIFLYLSSDYSTSFMLEDNQLIWQKVYEKGMNLNAAADFLILEEDTEEAFVENGVLFFKKKFDNQKDLAPLGYSKIQYPGYLGLGGVYWGNIQKREGDYKVTIDKVEFLDVGNDASTNNLTSLTAKKGIIKQNKRTKKVLSLLDAYFQKRFALKETQTVN